MVKHSPTKNYIIPLTLLLEQNKDAINKVCDALMTRGYSFIRLPSNFVKLIDDCLPLIDSFFSKSVKCKNKFSKDPIFGYFGIDHKESFRLLTGSRLKEHKFPSDFNLVENLVKRTDIIMYRLSIILSSSLFPYFNHYIKTLDIPFYSKNGWAMFDIARYSNKHDKNSAIRDGLNCKEHFDPGLLSLSLRSTQEGLQLKDEHGHWIKPPTDKNIAILWTGKAATIINPKLKPGVHRVSSYTNNFTMFNKPRIALWHEICLAEQEHKELSLSSINKKFKKTAHDAKIYEIKTGIPMTKSGL